MSHLKSPGKCFREALHNETPLQVVGTPNAYSAIMAKRVGFKAIYLSGGALSAITYGIPDLGIISLDNVLVEVNRITDAVETPLLVDIDTGFGSAFNIERTIHQMIKAGAAAVHLEDQISAKRCGHRPHKELVTTEEMVDRLTVAVRSKTDPDFFIIARTDALAVEGIDQAISRAKAYEAAGVDAIFAEACRTLDEYRRFVQALRIPVLANITEFGETPLFTTNELREAGVKIALYPFAAARMMNQAALHTYETLKQKGTQRELLGAMQTRDALYDFLHYHDYEKRLDKLLKKE
jgi:methylisocitrate lyase